MEDQESLSKSLEEIKEGIIKIGDMLEFLLSQVIPVADDVEDEEPNKALPIPKHFSDVERYKGYLG